MKNNMNWNKATQQQKLNYQQASKIWLSKIPLFEELTSWDNPMCKKQKHIDMLEKFYNNIVEALKRAASEVFTNSPKQKHNVPGWNKDVREKYKAARQAYLYWIDNHKPKSGPLFDIMKESKKEFKYALRACRKSQQKCKADAMAEALRNRPLKNSGRASEKARNHGFHLQWEEKQEIKQSLSCGENIFQHCWTHQKTVELATLCIKL